MEARRGCAIRIGERPVLMRRDPRRPVAGRDQRPRTVTVQDIATRAGVSRATAARALASSGHVSEEARKAVAQAAKMLAYVPNDVARSLRTRRSKVLGLLISDAANPFYAEIADNVTAMARPAGYHVMLCTSGDNPTVEAEYLDLLARTRVDGVIITPTPKAAPRLRLLIDRGIMIVQIDRVALQRKVSSVIVDNEQGARLAVQHLIDAGHERIALITGSTDIMSARARLVGYANTLKANRIAVRDELVRPGSFLADHGRQATLELLKLEQRPTAIFAANNLLAEWCYLTLREEGIRVPEDVSLVAFDEVPWMRIVGPPLTTVRQPVAEMARAAAGMLLGGLSGSPMETKRQMFKTELLIRGSVTRPTSPKRPIRRTPARSQQDQLEPAKRKDDINKG